jgi:uncharacterized membrane protein YfcA
MGIYLIICVLGIITGFLSGLCGIGGGIIMAPLLLFLPPLFGFEPLSMKVVAGLTIVQSLLGCLSGALTHKKLHFVSGKLSLYMGVSIFIAAIAGGAGSYYVSNEILLFIFACLAFIAAFLMLVPVKRDSENPDVEKLTFNRFRAMTAASGVGLLGGLVGQGGSFILIPLMTSFVNIPTRIAIGSNLAIVLFSSIAGFIGKAVTGQIEWLLAIPLAISVIPAASFGGFMSKRVPVKRLRQILAVLIAVAAIRIWLSIIY